MYTLYPVIVAPLLDGVVHAIVTLSELTDVVG
jgi:hypothetical protein